MSRHAHVPALLTQFGTPSKSRGCDGKNRYATFALAARNCVRTYERKRLRLDVYQCPFCRCFHECRSRRGRSSAVPRHEEVP